MSYKERYLYTSRRRSRGSQAFSFIQYHEESLLSILIAQMSLEFTKICDLLT